LSERKLFKPGEGLTDTHTQNLKGFDFFVRTWQILERSNSHPIRKSTDKPIKSVAKTKRKFTSLLLFLYFSVTY